MQISIGNSWDNLLLEEFKKDYFKNLLVFLDIEYREKKIYPPKDEIFNAFKMTPYEDVKIVILGQDPYHQEGQAHGLAFSVKDGVKIPPSLRNIYKELNIELGFDIPKSGELSKLAKNGVFLLNTTLTVEDSKPNSHKDIGWTLFTDRVIELLNERDESIVFLLWGAGARAKKNLITNKVHTVIEAAHPSPLSSYRGFLGTDIFIKCNEALGYEFDWSI
ncbi:MAG: uracil-DNA glycosylase [Eubacteriales bacterium]|nr:uracil-DNA glycosylase [Eubacteriales bacterium]MDY3333289.1 uracil-DNA glycosylase [Gallibacter sp.]